MCGWRLDHLPGVCICHPQRQHRHHEHLCHYRPRRWRWSDRGRWSHRGYGCYRCCLQCARPHRSYRCSRSARSYRPRWCHRFCWPYRAYRCSLDSAWPYRSYRGRCHRSDWRYWRGLHHPWTGGSNWPSWQRLTPNEHRPNNSRLPVLHRPRSQLALSHRAAMGRHDWRSASG